MAKDVYGYSLHYFEGDYASISSDMTMFPSGTTTVTSNDLYNGNIGKMVTTITNPTTSDILPLVNAYRYDQLNRLVESNSYEAIDAGNNAWQSAGTSQFKNTFQYDANGNIVTQKRWNQSGVNPMDNLSYSYNLSSSGQKMQNRLYHVFDGSSDATADEISHSTSYFTQTDVNVSNNYGYDGEGRLIRDNAEEIASIGWRVDGKVKSIDRTSGSTKKNLKFDYDAMGHRIAKHVYNSSNQLEKSTYYVLDAQGNAMGVYERAVDNVNSIVTYQLTENYIYGSSRLGVRNTAIDLLSTTLPLPVSAYTAHDIGKKSYELTNHLGNVLSVVSDKVVPIKDSSVYYQNDFSSTVSPFSASSSTTVSLDAGRMKVDCGVHYSNSHMTLSTIPGNSYRVYFDIDLAGSGNVAAFVRDLSTNVNVGLKIAVASGTSYYMDFTATNTSLFMAFENEVSGPRIFYIDNVIIEEYNIIGYTADIRQSSDYYPFGAPLSGRTFNVSSYKYGFNGLEMDNEIAGDGNSYTAQYWQYDPRLGRRWNIDPVVKHQESPYATFANSPIWLIDPNGADTLNGNAVLPQVKALNTLEGQIKSLKNIVEEQIKERDRILEDIESIETKQQLCELLIDFNPFSKNPLSKPVEGHVEGNANAIILLKARFIAMEFQINENIDQLNKKINTYNFELDKIELSMRGLDSDDNMFIGGKNQSVFLEQNDDQNHRALFRLEIDGKAYRFGYAQKRETKSLIVKLDHFKVVESIRPSFELLGISAEDAFRSLPANQRNDEAVKKGFKKFMRKL